MKKTIKVKRTEFLKAVLKLQYQKGTMVLIEDWNDHLKISLSDGTSVERVEVVTE